MQWLGGVGAAHLTTKPDRGSASNLQGAAPQPLLPFPEVESPTLSVPLHHQRGPSVSCNINMC